MGDESDAPTGYAPTELGAVIDETEAVTAWSLDDDEDWPPPRFSPRLITTLALAASFVLLAGAGALAYWHMQRPVLGDVAMLGSAGGLTGSAPDFDAATGFPDPPPPPTATVTVERPVPVQTPTPQPVALPAPQWNEGHDRRMLNTLAAYGWSIWDPASTVMQARQVCTVIQQGGSPQAIVDELSGPGSPTTRIEAEVFVRTAGEVYPACR